MSDPEVDIRPVTDAEAGELLTLRRAAFVSEAQLYNDPHIPPLTQTLEELRADLAADGVVTLGARAGHRLVGSIRVLLEDKRATLGRLAVAPDLQGQGIGTQLLFAVLPYLPEGTEEIWVFTGQDSTHNIALYEKQQTMGRPPGPDGHHTRVCVPGPTPGSPPHCSKSARRSMTSESDNVLD